MTILLNPHLWPRVPYRTLQWSHSGNFKVNKNLVNVISWEKNARVVCKTRDVAANKKQEPGLAPQAQQPHLAPRTSSRTWMSLLDCPSSNPASM